MATEEMSFENVDRRTDGRRIPDYIHMDVRELLKENYCETFVKFSDFDKIDMNRRGLLKKHFCRKTSKYLQ